MSPGNAPSFFGSPSFTNGDNQAHLSEQYKKGVEFQLEEHPVDQVRQIKVGIIGAGLAGISAGILLPAKLPGLDLRIYEKNADVVCSFCLTQRP